MPSCFAGKERDAESGLDYFGARYYGSSMGRFMSPDPSGLYYADPTNPQSLNLYSYALNNPLKFVDPTGLYCFYGGQGDTVENDSDPSDYDFTSDGTGECNSTGGQWIDNPSTTVTVSDGGDNGNTLSTFPSDVSQNIQFIPGAGCSAALQGAGKTARGVARAYASWPVLSGAASSNNISPALLAAVGMRETDFQNVQEVLKGGGPGPGMGVFQLTNQQGVSPAQAFSVPFAANYAANMLSSNMNYLSNAFSFTPPQLLQATAASYNLGKYGIHGNPNTIDKVFRTLIIQLSQPQP